MDPNLQHRFPTDDGKRLSKQVKSFLEHPEDGTMRAVFAVKGTDPRAHGWICDIFGGLWFCAMPSPPRELTPHSDRT